MRASHTAGQSFHFTSFKFNHYSFICLFYRILYLSLSLSLPIAVPLTKKKKSCRLPPPPLLPTRERPCLIYYMRRYNSQPFLKKVLIGDKGCKRFSRPDARTSWDPAMPNGSPVTRCTVGPAAGVSFGLSLLPRASANGGDGPV